MKQTISVRRLGEVINGGACARQKSGASTDRIVETGGLAFRFQGRPPGIVYLGHILSIYFWSNVSMPH